MADLKVQTVAATLESGSNKLNIPVKINTGDYALRVFTGDAKEKTKKEILYRSTRISNLKQTEAGFECTAIQEATDQKFEIKNIKTNLVVVCGSIKTVEKPKAVSGQQPAEKKEAEKK